MRRTIWIASVAMMLSLGASGAATHTTEDQARTPDLQAWLVDQGLHELEPVRANSQTFLVPQGTAFAFTMDWTSGTSTLELLPEPFEAQDGGSGGCITQYTPDTRAPWAVPGVGTDQECVPTTIKGPLSSTTHIADTDGSSSATSASYSPSPFFINSVLIYCESSAVEAALWPDALVEQHCFTREFGSMPPSEWPSYRGNCGLSFGASEGITGCIHQG